MSRFSSNRFDLNELDEMEPAPPPPPGPNQQPDGGTKAGRDWSTQRSLPHGGSGSELPCARLHMQASDGVAGVSCTVSGGPSGVRAGHASCECSPVAEPGQKSALCLQH